jgi:hypothetical protein
MLSRLRRGFPSSFDYGRDEAPSQAAKEQGARETFRCFKFLFG